MVRFSACNQPLQRTEVLHKVVSKETLMAKLSWNKFVETYPGHGYKVTTGTQPENFKKPGGTSPQNQKIWPTIPSLIAELLGPRLKGDWAWRSEKIPRFKRVNGKDVKAPSATGYYFIFSDIDDSTLAASILGASKPPQPVQGFSSLAIGSEFDMRKYERLLIPLGYLVDK